MMKNVMVILKIQVCIF